MSGSIARMNAMYEGLTVGEASDLFGMPVHEIRSKIIGLRPIAARNSKPVYAVRDLARLIHAVAISGDDDDETFRRIMRSRVDDLPPKLRENFWKTERVRQTYERERGDLWPTHEIVERNGEVLKTLRLSLLLLPDTLAREATLDEKQRAIVTRLIDNAMNDVRRKLVDAFTEQRRSPRGEPEDTPEAVGVGDEEL